MSELPMRWNEILHFLLETAPAISRPSTRTTINRRTILAFINEFIPADDVVKYGIEAIDEIYSKITFDPDWTVDRERDIYLRQMSTGREESANQSTWSFYWKGSLLRLVLIAEGGALETGELFMHYKLGRTVIPPEILAEREEILIDLKEALTARNSNGVYTTRPVSKITFAF